MKDDAREALSHERKLKKLKGWIWVFAVVACLLSLFIYIKTIPPPTGLYDAFAKCISNTSTTFYGASWCPHCHEQKNQFGSAAQYLPYVECSLNPGEQFQVCTDHGVTEYPTWFFPDNSSSTGVQTMDFLAQKTGCSLPTSTSL